MSTDLENRLPDPDPEQTRLGMEAVRRALAGEKVKLWRDSEGRLCVVPVEEGDVERA